MSPSFCILYVDNPALSAAFYADILDRPPLESSPTFAMFSLNPHSMLGLWSKHTVEPAPAAGGGGSEIALPVADDKTVDARHADWRARGLPVLQPPTRLDFGYAFVVADLDGHRLRVFAPAQP